MFVVEGYYCKWVGFNYLVFYGGIKEWVDDFWVKLKVKGIKFLYEERYFFVGGENYYVVFFEDLNGIKVEICIEVIM